MSAATQETYNSIREGGLATPTTPDETQEVDGIRLCYAWKGHKTRSSIYERTFPDKLTTALCIDGPLNADNAMTFHSDGRITLMTGKRDPNKGAASGKLNIKAGGGQQQYLSRVDLEFNEGDDQKPQGDGQALNIICYGDYVEQCIGSERHITAEKILIEATSELVIKGGSVKIQSESDIEMAGSAINTAQINKKDIVLGQKMTFGAGEETSVQFDPRANQAVVSPGHISHIIAGDYKQYIGGVSNITVAGLPMSIPLVKDRSASYSLTTTALGYRVVSAGLGTITATGPMTLAGSTFTGTFGAAQLTTAAANVTTAALTVQPASMTVTSPGNITLTGALIYLN